MCQQRQLPIGRIASPSIVCDLLDEISDCATLQQGRAAQGFEDDGDRFRNDFPCR